MALTVDYLYKFSLRLMKKNQAGGLKSTDFSALWSESSRAYQDDLLGRFQARNNGKEGANTGLIQDETIMQKLSAFIKPVTLTITSGNADKPEDFIYRLAMRCNGVDAYKINHDQLATVNDSVIDPPSIDDDKYYFVEYLNYYSFLPTATPTADIDYISTPIDVCWAYTLNAAGKQIYNDFGITGVEVIYGGVGYTTPTIAFSAPSGGGVQATGTLTVVGGVITAVVMTNIGYGYAGLTPTATITGSSTTPARLGSPIVSVQPMWDSQSCMEITKRMFKTLGVSFKDSDFEGFGQTVINTGV